MHLLPLWNKRKTVSISQPKLHENVKNLQEITSKISLVKTYDMEQPLIKTHFAEMNLGDMLEQLGEDATKSILSSFSCPLSKDIENFIKYKAIEFSKRTTAKTHLVFWQTEDKKSTEFVGYYTITSKVITIDRSVLSNTEAKKLRDQGVFDSTKQEYTVSAPLIAQLGKNFTDGNDTLISGADLLQLAVNKIHKIQKEIGGRFMYLECEDNEKLLTFYKKSNFKVFGKRKLDRDETDVNGNYLIQLFAMF